MKINLIVAIIKWAYVRWAKDKPTYKYSPAALIGYCKQHKYLAEIIGRKGGNVEAIFYRHKQDLKWRKTVFVVKSFIPSNDYKVSIKCRDGNYIIATSMASNEGVTYE